MRSTDRTTGRPLEDEREALETLDDAELQLELTIALHDPERRQQRYAHLAAELLSRRRGYRPQQPVVEVR